MEYKVEALSPVKIKVEVATPAEEVDAALAAAALQLRNQVQMDGFRKGKVPLNIIKKRYQQNINNDARQDLINVHINQILSETGKKPVSGLNISGDEKPLEQGKDYTYTMEFETLPEIDLPVYEGLTVEQEKVVPNPEATEEMLKRIRRLGAKLKPVDGIAPAKDFQVANIDFEVIENGEPIPDLNVHDFDLELGTGASLPEFEELVKGIPVGNTGEKEINFPDGFIDTRLAGKKVLMRVKVNSVKEPDHADFEASLKKNNTNLDQLSKILEESYEKEMTEVNKSRAQNKLINKLIEKVDVPFPQTFLDHEKWRLVSELENSLAKQGKSLASIGKTRDQVLKEFEEPAEKFARQQTMLMLIAEKEGLDVTDQELARHVYNSCIQSGENYREVIQSMHNNGLIALLKERMLADKAMDLIYDKAEVTLIDPVEKTEDDAAEKDVDGDKEKADNLKEQGE